MNNNKVLIDIKPFNDVFYKSCFYNSVIPIIRHYDRNILHVLINDVIAYSGEMDNFQVDYISIKSIEEIVKDMNIDVKYYGEKQDLIDEIKKSILNNNLVIIWADCYYEPIRKDTFNKKHISHTILINGFDEEEETIQIIEHTHSDNLTYKQCSINGKDLETCYRKHFENFEERRGLPTYLEFSLNNKGNVRDKYLDSPEYCLEVYLKNVKDKKDDIKKGLEKLRQFVDYYGEVVLGEDVLKEKSDEMILSFNSIINASLVEMYKITHILGENHELVSMSKKKIDMWNSLRTIIGKYKYSSIYKKEVLTNSINSIKTIYDIELRYSEVLFNL